MKTLTLVIIALTYTACSSTPKRAPSVFETVFPTEFVNRDNFTQTYRMFENLDKP